MHYSRIVLFKAHMVSDPRLKMKTFFLIFCCFTAIAFGSQNDNENQNNFNFNLNYDQEQNSGLSNIPNILGRRREAIEYEQRGTRRRRLDTNYFYPLLNLEELGNDTENIIQTLNHFQRDLIELVRGLDMDFIDDIMDPFSDGNNRNYQTERFDFDGSFDQDYLNFTSQEFEMHRNDLLRRDLSINRSDLNQSSDEEESILPS